jgi:hypothetical protein
MLKAKDKMPPFAGGVLLVGRRCRLFSGLYESP